VFWAARSPEPSPKGIRPIANELTLRLQPSLVFYCTKVHSVPSRTKRLDLHRTIPSLLEITIAIISASTLPYSKYLGAACRAHTLSCWPTILHGYALSILHLPQRSYTTLSQRATLPRTLAEAASVTRLVPAFILTYVSFLSHVFYNCPCPFLYLTYFWLMSRPLLKLGVSDDTCSGGD